MEAGQASGAGSGSRTAWPDDPLTTPALPLNAHRPGADGPGPKPRPGRAAGQAVLWACQGSFKTKSGFQVAASPDIVPWAGYAKKGVTQGRNTGNNSGQQATLAMVNG